ncbi:MAG: DUF1801 domain-containing protein, partial [Sphingomonas sp.]
MPRNPRVDDYIAASADFAKPILTHLRARIHDVIPDVDETIKWRMPFFIYRGRPLANMAAFKAHAAFGLWDRAAIGMGQEAEAMGQYGRLTTLSDLPADSDLDARLHEARVVVESGDRTKRPARPRKPEADVPPALAAALAGDDRARATFAAFPPSCRRE